MGKLIIKKPFGRIIIDLDSANVYKHGSLKVKFNAQFPELNVQVPFEDENIIQWANHTYSIIFNSNLLTKKLKDKNIINYDGGSIQLGITNEQYKILKDTVKSKKEEFEKERESEIKSKESIANIQHFTYITFTENVYYGIRNVKWDANQGDPKFNSEVKKVLNSFLTFRSYYKNDIVYEMIHNFLKEFIVSTDKENVNYKISRNQFDKIISLAKNIKSKLFKNENNKILKEIEKWKSKTDIELAYELYTNSIHVTEDDYFSTCDPFCDDCFYIQVFKKDVAKQLGLNSKTYEISSRNGKTYTYNLVDEQNIKILAQKKKSEIENYRNKQIENLKKQIK